MFDAPLSSISQDLVAAEITFLFLVLKLHNIIQCLHMVLFYAVLMCM